MAPFEMYLGVNFYTDMISTTNSVVEGFDYTPPKEIEFVPKIKEQIKRKPIMRLNTNIRNRRVYRCQNRM